MSRIRIGDDLKAYLKKRKANNITLVRVCTLKDLPREKGDIEPDYTLYRREHNDLIRVFLKLMYDTKRIYYDSEPDYLGGVTEYIQLSDQHMEQLSEAHDENTTEYADFKDAETFFEDNELYIEVKA